MREFTGRALRSAAAAAERVQTALNPDRAFLQRLQQVVGSRPAPTVVLVGGQALETPVTTYLAGVAVETHRFALEEVDAAPLADLDLQLAALGQIDVVVLDSPAGTASAPLVERLVHHLASGGVLLVRDVGADDDEVATLLQRWSESGSVADPTVARPARAGRPGKRPGRKVGVVRVEHLTGHAQVTLERRHYLKLREEQANVYLAKAGPQAGRVLETRDAVQWTSRARVREAGDPPKRLPTGYAAPELNLREYRDVRCLPGQVAVQGPVILPDSFRHNQRRNLGNQRMRTVSEPFAWPDQDRAEVATLTGDYFYLDSSYRGHFGHAMTEQLSRLWGWSQAKEAFPGLKVLMLEERRTGLFTFETELYSAAGVPPDDIVVAPGPVAVERLVAATPTFSQPHYVHPEIADVWSTVSDVLSGRASSERTPRRIFCSRRHDKRACQNTDEVERLFADHGFTVVFPEDHSLPEQALMFRDAEALAGFAGSAMFNLLFCTSPKKVIMLASENYWAQNEYMIASVLGHDLTVGWCRPERPRVVGAAFDARTFHSPFVFDPEREGRLVLEVLEAL